jgi:hypothetical protein
MKDNIYKSPDANLLQPDTKPGRPVRAIIAGVFLDIFLTLLFDILKNIGAGAYIGFMRGAYDSDETFNSFLSAAEPWGIYYNIGILLGIIATMIAAYVCARIARHHVYRYVLIMVLIGVSISIPFMQVSTPVDRIVILSMINILAAMSGAWLYIYRHPDIK